MIVAGKYGSRDGQVLLLLLDDERGEVDDFAPVELQLQGAGDEPARSDTTIG